MAAYPFPLHHLLVKIVWEGSKRVELSGALSTGEDIIFIDNTATADSDQRHTMTAQTFIQIYISSLPLSGHGDGSAQKHRLHIFIDLH